ncbi:flavin reductase family protein [Arthrobacter sp. CAU 1506]|uniref:flavin reductase family protein n=1 Tax=Arthrobacter sp. CAU 1506 TaxID=2560052 RepID=UPI0010ACE730|nr:flavin reductase family protein [Arthrobacter sp. CAU 1506]TJY67188.1 flavin reductase family protein [Arthrobacter sp. CAU 1506]
MSISSSVSNSINAPRAYRLPSLERPTVSGLKGAFSCFPSGVVAICSMIQGEPVGMVASTFTPVSLDPPLVSVCMDRQSSTWPRLRNANALGISVLSEEQGTMCRQLSSKFLERFNGLQLQVSDSGAAFIEGASATFDCTIDSVIPAGDHFLVLLWIQALKSHLDQVPLVYHGSSFKQLKGVVG